MDADMDLQAAKGQKLANTESVQERSVSLSPDLNRQKPFRLWSTLAIQSSISATPLAIGSYLSTVIGVGGSPVYFFGYILASVMSLLICASLSEIAAVFPHATGQIYWTAVVYPPKYSRGLSYVLGWLTCSAWFCAAASTSLFTAQLILALIEVCRVHFVALPWHTYMIYIGSATFAMSLNLPLFKVYPYLLNGLVPFTNLGAIFILIALLVRAHPKQSANFVFTEFINSTGWSSNAMVFFLGLLPGCGSLIGFDAAAHMTEELPEPRTQVPKIIMYGTIINAIMGLPMTLVYSFCIVSPDNLLTPVGGQPIIQIFVDGFDSLTLTVIGSIIVIVTFLFGATTVTTVFSRTWWSFAHANGLPFSDLFSKTNERLHLPVNSILFCFISTVALGAIQLGSTTALSAIAGACIISFYASYTVPILGLLINRRAVFPEKRYFNMGKIGPVVNIISVSWMTMMVVWLCFPSYVPVELLTMNWSSVVMSGVVFIATVNWFVFAKKRFVSPTERIEDDIEGVRPSQV